MPAARVQVIDGITYPREVPVIEGMPEGWIGVEQAYGPGSKTAGMIYTRYSSLDGRHKKLLGPKQVVQAHCEDMGIPWEPEYQKYIDAFNERKDREAAARALEKAARGEAAGARREELVALSREHFGELTGPIVFGFPGWKCRWDFLPDSQQTPKVFTAQDGREWKLLKDLECYFGTRAEQGGDEWEGICAMVQAGKINFAAHELFSSGSTKAREAEGSCELDPANIGQEVTESREERALRMVEREQNSMFKKRRTSRVGGIDNLDGFRLDVFPEQPAWGALATLEDQQKACAEFKEGLLKRKFKDDIELVVVNNVAKTCRFASRITGIYYRLGENISGRQCYQKLLSTPKVAASVACDGLYIMWNASKSQWQITTRPSEEAACIAYCKEDEIRLTVVAGPWQVQQTGQGDFEADNSLRIIAA